MKNLKKISIISRKFAILMIVGFLAVQALQSPLMDNEINTVNKDVFKKNDLSNKQRPEISDKSNLLTYPFLENQTGIVNWIGNSLTNNYTSGISATLKGFLAESNRSGVDIVDNAVYFEDTAVGLDGLFNLLGFDSWVEKNSIFQSLKESNFWNETEENSGYYSFLNEKYEKATNIKELNGNIQPIITFSDYLITENPEIAEYSKTDQNIPNLITDQWNIVNENFWDDEQQMFNHSSSDDTKFIKDQFLVAISGFLIHRANDIWISDSEDDNIKANANDTASLIMNDIMDNYMNDAGAFRKDIASDPSADLATNAYGIWALSEMFIESGGDDTALMELAEDVFQLLNSSLWNETYSLFMKEASNLNSLTDRRICLEDNSIMITALKNLFEITGNFTYYKTLETMLDGVLNYLRDPLFGTYFNSILSDDGDSDPNTGTIVYNQNKSLGAHAYLFRSYFKVMELTDYFSSNISLNATEIIKGETDVLNVTANSFLNINLTHSESGISSFKKTFIDEPGFFLTLRDAEGNLLDSWDKTGTSDGRISYNLDLDPNYSIGDYSLSYYTNYSYLLPVFNETSFSIESGLEILGGNVFTSSEDDKIYIGGSAWLNITINSSRINNTYFNISLGGVDILDNNSIEKVPSKEKNSYLIMFEILSDAKEGQSKLEISISNDTVLYESLEVSFTNYYPIEVQNVILSKKLFLNYANNLEIRLKNHIDSPIEIDLDIEGKNIVDESVNMIVGSKEIRVIKTTLDILNNTSLGKITFGINFTRNSDGYSFVYKTFSSILKPVFEIRSIKLPSTIYQGDQAKLVCEVINNLDQKEGINFFINDNLYNKINTLEPGENSFTIPLAGKFNNPYEFGNKNYEFKITNKDDSILYENSFFIDLKMGSIYVFWGYIFPFVLPLIGVLVMRHYSIENKKRLGQL